MSVSGKYTAKYVVIENVALITYFIYFSFIVKEDKKQLLR